MTALAVATVAYNEETGSTGQMWVLMDSSQADKPNTMVTHVDFSVASQDAVFQLTVGRIETSESGGNNYSSRFFRGNLPTRTPPGLKSFDPSTNFHHVHGIYYVSGHSPFQLNFQESLESLKDAETGTDQAFAVLVKRIDTSTSVRYGLNIWHRSY